MQIFFLHNNPEHAAKMLCHLDKRRAQKQLLEGIQLLNNCCISLGILTEPRPKTKDGRYYMQRNFPKVFQEWLLTSASNLEWFCIFLENISWRLQYPRSHFPIEGSAYNNLYCRFEIYERIPFSKRTPFPNYAKSKAKNLDFTNIKSTVNAYRHYLQAQLQ
jgi:hypothetical protein